MAIMTMTSVAIIMVVILLASSGHPTSRWRSKLAPICFRQLGENQSVYLAHPMEHLGEAHVEYAHQFDHLAHQFEHLAHQSKHLGEAHVEYGHQFHHLAHQAKHLAEAAEYLEH